MTSTASRFFVALLCASAIYIGGCAVPHVATDVADATSDASPDTITPDVATDTGPTCSAMQVLCAGACVDTRTNTANCGSCGHSCAAGEVCTAGSCTLSCPATQMPCGGLCVSVSNDNANCGACGHACAAGEVCSAGACGLSCASPFTMCSGDAGAPFCANTQTDTNNCGSCGHACDAGFVCNAGTCTLSCPAGFMACDGRCRDVSTDRNNCGACGTVCAAGQVCSSGSCSASCGTGLDTCGTGSTATCTSLSSDPLNCGACGTTCPTGANATPFCAMAHCGLLCAANTADCNGDSTDGCEVALNTATHCGACGRTCSFANASATCGAGGVCTLGTCNTGFADCDSDPSNGCEVNLQTDRTHCGACTGTTAACAGGQLCSAGTCEASCGTGLTQCGTGASATCQNLQSDPANCASCGNACPAGTNATAFCTSGTCGITCAAGFADCNGNATDGCEVPLDTISNCGACGRACTFAHASATCGAAGACTLGVCDTGFANCDGNAANGCEVDLTTDRAHCGACTGASAACADGQVCSSGSCVASCGTGLTTCGTGATATCRNVQGDVANCGACNNACPSGTNSTAVCAGGTCGIRCAAGFGDCDGNPANGCEVALNTVTNCGACGRGCAFAHAGATCGTGGVCTMGACATGFGDCDSSAANGCEVDLNSDRAHCGACTGASATCAAGQVCSGGACSASCRTGLMMCGTGATSTCADLSDDPNNCGACGTVCTAGANEDAVCVGARGCQRICRTGFGDCNALATDGCERNIATDPSNCGACGLVCGSSRPTCVGGGCSFLRGLSWTSSSTASPVSLTVTPGTGAADTETFHYQASGSQVYSARSFTFQATSPQTRTLMINWNYSGYHAYFSTSAQLQAFADGPLGRTTVNLFGPAAVGGGFNVMGSTTLTLTTGFAFGFIATGSNFDSDSRLIGDIAVTAP